MTQVTLQVSEELGAQLNAAGLWLPTILELSLARFRTRAAEGAAELRDFLAENPSPREVSEFYLSQKSQRRMNRLLTLNSAGKADEAMALEMDEWGQLYHISIMLKLQALEHLKGISNGFLHSAAPPPVS